MNTCPMDSVLQLLYNMHTLNILPTYLFQGDKELMATLNLIEQGQFNLAREKQLIHYITALDKSGDLHVSEGGKKVDLFGDTLTYTKRCSLFGYD